MNKFTISGDVFCLVLILVFQYCAGQSGQISSKLDFGSNEPTTENSILSSNVVKAVVHLQHSSEPKKSIVSSNADHNSFNFQSVAPLMYEQSKSSYPNGEVICLNGDCNAKSGEKISTDIVVKVVSNINDKLNNKTDVDEGGDVPVIVGYAGTNLKPANSYDLISRKVDGLDDIPIQRGQNPSNNINYYQIGHINDIPLKSKPVQHQVSFLNPAYNNHYFGESPPPQYVWYRGQNTYNPHAYNPNLKSYKPVIQWQLKFPVYVQHTTPKYWTHATTCTCSNPESHWYPNFGSHQPTPSSTINDKLAPLN